MKYSKMSTQQIVFTLRGTTLTQRVMLMGGMSTNLKNRLLGAMSPNERCALLEVLGSVVGFVRCQPHTHLEFIRAVQHIKTAFNTQATDGYNVGSLNRTISAPF